MVCGLGIRVTRRFTLNASAKPWSINDSPKIAAVLVNWRQPIRTLEAVQALNAQSFRPLIIVVDNGSGDNSAEILARQLPEDALLVLRDTNGGFGAGCNAGIKKAISLGADYIWLINNDASPEVDSLERMLAVLMGRKEIGIVGANIKDPSLTVPDHAGTVMSRFAFNCRYTLADDDLDGDKYAWITGACMLLPVPALKKVGMFDESYFMYWEDADLCSRFRAAGYSLRVAARAIVHHSAGTSSDHLRLQRFEWHYRSQTRWIQKNYPWKIFGKTIVSMRHLIKSMLTLDWPRFLLSLKLSLQVWRS